MRFVKVYIAWLLFVALYLSIARLVFASAILSPPGYPEIGSFVLGGTDKSVLFVHPSGTLDQHNPNFTYDKSTGMLTATDLTLSGLSGGACYVNGSSQLQSELYLNRSRGGTGIDSSSLANGELLIGGPSGFALSTISGTANQVNVSNGPNSITLSTPQDIAPTSDVTFNKVTTNTVQASTSSGLQFRSNTSALIGTFGAGSGTTAEFEGAVQSNTSFVLQDPGLGTNTITLVAPTLGASYSMTLPTANSFGFLKNDGLGSLSFSAINLASSDVTGILPPSNGGTGVNSLSDIVGTTNQINVAGGTGSVIGGNVTLSLPQDIHTSATPTFSSVTLSSLTSGRVALVGAGGLITDSPTLTFGSSVLNATGSSSASYRLTKTGAGAGSFEIEYFGTNAGAFLNGASLTNPIYVNQGGSAQTQFQTDGNVRFYNSVLFEETGSGSDYVGITAPSSVASNYTITLPDAAPSSAGRVLMSTDNTGTLEWAALRSVHTFTNTSITATSHYNQSWRYTGTSAQTFTAFTITALPDGGRITIIGTSDTNTITIPPNATGIVYQNGTKILGLGESVTYEKVASLSGLVEVK